MSARRRLLGLLGLLVVLTSACNTAVFQSKGVPPADRDKESTKELTANEDEGSEGGGREEDRKQIEEVFVWFFDGSDLLADGVATPEEVDAKAAKVYNVEKIKDTLASVMQVNSDVFSKLSAKIEKIEFKDDDRASVTFTLNVSGEPTLTGATGDAVRDNGEWKIDAQLTCDLVALADSTVPCDPGTPAV